jgi:hypothetical protein
LTTLWFAAFAVSTCEASRIAAPFFKGSLNDLPHKSAFSFHHKFLEVKHGNTTAQTNLPGAKLLEESKAGPTAGWDE